MEAYISSDTHYITSGHRTAPTGIQVGCSNCHVPPTFPANIVYKTTSGIKDIYHELSNDFADPMTWEARREDLAHKVRDWYIANDSAPCRECHTPDKLKPKRESGQRQHELAERENVSCIGCHFNLVHQPVKPTKEFADYGRVYADMMRVTAKR
jgi:nitrate/TMAO reductase-like tetraheme cytochrome c subunit